MTEEKPRSVDGVGTELGGVGVVNVASRSSSLVPHQPADASKEVKSVVRPTVLPVGRVVVETRPGT